MNELSSISPDSRPVVRARNSQLAPWIFGGVSVVGAVLLFTSLEIARSEKQQGTPLVGAGVAPARPLPELIIPPVAAPAAGRPGIAAEQLLAAPMSVGRSTISSRATSPKDLPQSFDYRPAPVLRPAVTQYYPGSVQPDAQPRLAVGSSQQSSLRLPGLDERGASHTGLAARALADSTLTIVQGTLIPAVLETGLDSTQPGPVRAMVSRDVRGFDGVRILIPRGSRLIGEYQADLAPGQKRALVSWGRLIRPDGVSVDLKAPATDAVGRAGIPGKVNNHTFRRITDSLLQTLVNAGSGLTQRATPVIVVPGGQQGATVTVRDPTVIKPTLSVAPGARISVFVTQDLDFSTVEGR